MSDSTNEKPADDATTPNELLSRLRLIEDQPLAERAASFAHVHDELQAALERGDAHSRNG